MRGHECRNVRLNSFKLSSVCIDGENRFRMKESSISRQLNAGEDKLLYERARRQDASLNIDEASENRFRMKE